MEPQIQTDTTGLLEMTCNMWFDLKRFSFDKKGQEVRLPLGYRERPYDQKLLIVTAVSGVAINDQDNAEAYGLRDVQVTSGSIRIKSSSPLEIVLTVGEQCRLYITDLRGLYGRGISIRETASTLLRFLHLRRGE